MLLEDLPKYVLSQIMEELTKQVSVSLKGNDQIEIRVGKESILFAIPAMPSFVQDKEPPVVDVMKIIAGKVPGLWGYCAAENGGEDWRCRLCGKEFLAKRVFHPKENQ